MRRMECQELLRLLLAAFNTIECMTAWSAMHGSTSALERNALRPELAGQRPSSLNASGLIVDGSQFDALLPVVLLNSRRSRISLNEYER